MKTTTEEQALETARKLGERAGANAAEWEIQHLWGGRATREEKETAQSVLQRLEDGDPILYDSFSLPNLSGEWAGDPTPHDLFQKCKGYEYFPEIMEHQEMLDELCTEWETAVSDSFFSTLEKSARDFLANS